MQTVETLQVYEVGRRGKPVASVGPGDLAEPYSRSLWKRALAIGVAIVEVAREARALEAQLLGRGSYRRSSEY